jgi:hypothetical protein
MAAEDLRDRSAFSANRFRGCSRRVFVDVPVQRSRRRDAELYIGCEEQFSGGRCGRWARISLPALGAIPLNQEQRDQHHQSEGGANVNAANRRAAPFYPL